MTTNRCFQCRLLVHAEVFVLPKQLAVVRKGRADPELFAAVANARLELFCWVLLSHVLHEELLVVGALVIAVGNLALVHLLCCLKLMDLGVAFQVCRIDVLFAARSHWALVPQAVGVVGFHVLVEPRSELDAHSTNAAGETAVVTRSVSWGVAQQITVIGKVFVTNFARVHLSVRVLLVAVELAFRLEDLVTGGALESPLLLRVWFASHNFHLQWPEIDLLMKQ